MTTQATDREKLLIDAGQLAHETVCKMVVTPDGAEFKRLDKVAQRATSLMGSLARYRSPEEFHFLSSSGLDAGSQEQEAA